MTSLSVHAHLIARPGKACSKCRRYLPLEDYYPVRRQGVPKGYRADCKLCVKKSRIVR